MTRNSNTSTVVMSPAQAEVVADILPHPPKGQVRNPPNPGQTLQDTKKSEILTQNVRYVKDGPITWIRNVFSRVFDANPTTQMQSNTPDQQGEFRRLRSRIYQASNTEVDSVPRYNS